MKKDSSQAHTDTLGRCSNSTDSQGITGIGPNDTSTSVVRCSTWQEQSLLVPTHPSTSALHWQKDTPTQSRVGPIPARVGQDLEPKRTKQ
eukprot:m.345169 g.345169  ORF g.345169 m.345169 type:complete len:90 (-) comp55809_c0_seq2:680-949(-)